MHFFVSLEGRGHACIMLKETLTCVSDACLHFDKEMAHNNLTLQFSIQDCQTCFIGPISYQRFEALVCQYYICSQIHLLIMNTLCMIISTF